MLSGDTVEWTNSGDFAPHTATDDNGLWALTGTSSGLLGGPRGFGPGEARSRAFEAGTFSYHCAVHPAMKGTVAAAPYAYAESRILRSRRSRWYVAASWATAAPAAGLAFDVEHRRGNGAWQRWKTGTVAVNGRFRGGKRGRVWEVRSRLRRAADPSKASGWSPAARVVVG